MVQTTRFSLARRLRAGETVHAAWCGLASPIVAEMIGREGFGAVVLDQQHGLFDMAATAQGIASLHLAGTAPMVRVPLGDFAVISRALDLGAEAVIAPMINTLADAKALVAAAKYPPIGERSWGPQRAATLGGFASLPDYLHAANEQTFVFAMIETRVAVDNVEAIAALEGIDGLFVGPNDLSLALTRGKVLDPHSKEVEKELDVILAAAQKAGKVAGIYCSDAHGAKSAAQRGFRYLAIGSDLAYLRAGAAEQLRILKS